LRKAFLVLLIAGIVFLAGCTSTPDPKKIKPTEIKTFTETGRQVCKENGKPVIRLYSTTSCPHCKWIKNAFDSTVKEYLDQGKIVAFHWQLDTGDNTLTPETESSVPVSETNIYTKFNPNKTVPTFVFGCKYFRIGNAYEKQNDLKAEIGEFKAVIEALLKE
jgi:thioredoxin-related protein